MGLAIKASLLYPTVIDVMMLRTTVVPAMHAPLILKGEADY
jgi:hypothetical protein